MTFGSFLGLLIMLLLLQVGTSCSLALLDHLKEPSPGEGALKVMVSLKQELAWTCQGGQGCCGRNHLKQCEIGQGICSTDTHCSGNLVCGPPGSCNGAQGLGGSEDRCCEERCSEDKPCTHGEGPCDPFYNHCQSPGFHTCGSNTCLNRIIFPVHKFPNLSESQGFTSSDNCCHRRCVAGYHLCGQDEQGCAHDEDCGAGLACDGGFCRDNIDECADPRLHNCGIDGHAYCTENIGVNPVRFYCTCESSFYDFFEANVGCKRRCHVDYNICGLSVEGCANDEDCKSGLECSSGYCQDIDECSRNLHNCGANAYCHNDIGGSGLPFHCHCNTGYTSFVGGVGCRPNSYGLRVAWASSVWQGSKGPVGAPWFAVDGDRAGQCCDVWNFFNTAEEPHPWLAIDLLGVHMVSQVNSASNPLVFDCSPGDHRP